MSEKCPKVCQTLELVNCDGGGKCPKVGQKVSEKCLIFFVFGWIEPAADWIESLEIPEILEILVNPGNPGNPWKSWKFFEAHFILEPPENCFGRFTLVKLKKYAFFTICVGVLFFKISVRHGTIFSDI